MPEARVAVAAELAGRLGGSAGEEPVVVWKALADLLYVIADVIADVGADAPSEALTRGVPIGTVATALGTSEAAARRYVSSLHS
ncbi:hypothetical protein ACGFYQ_30085 [Streptomyces sp. NPDC048258]|uniref:hypothetical protein n=1 Tax=Streptomyces sp. NPDC048258 TaxID=3365527 RepID=UPI003719BDB7